MEGVGYGFGNEGGTGGESGTATQGAVKHTGMIFCGNAFGASDNKGFGCAVCVAVNACMCGLGSCRVVGAVEGFPCASQGAFQQVLLFDKRLL